MSVIIHAGIIISMIHNPIIRGFNPDPSITFDGKKYIIATSTFEYYPGVALYTSEDLCSWKYETSVMTSRNGFSLLGAKNSSGLYAATIRFHDGRYYMVTTNKNGFGNFISHSDSLTGPWSEALFISRDGIDPSIIFLPDGSCFYTQNGKGGLFGAFIDPESGKLLENLRLISSGLSGYATEAPHIYLKDEMYYLIFAEGGTEYGHHEVVGRSSSIYGPYELREKPILSHVDRKGHMIQATGHADLVELPDGRWIAVFLAIRMPGRAHLHNLGRETFMADVTWQNGWPIIGKNGWVELDEPSSIETVPIKDEYISFESDIAASSALRVRAENASNYKRIGDNLFLHGGDTLSKEKGEPALLLLRQTEFVSAFSATVRTDETLTGKAGVSAFYNSDYHADLFVEKAEDSLRLSFRRKIHDLEVVVCEKIIPLSSSVRFEIRTDSEWYVFFADGNEIGRASIASFATEGTMYMTFTGTLLGIFAEDGDGIFVDGFGFKGE